MKRTLWMIGAFCAAAVGFLVVGARRVQPMDEMAHQLETAWADHHTVV